MSFYSALKAEFEDENYCNEIRENTSFEGIYTLDLVLPVPRLLVCLVDRDVNKTLSCTLWEAQLTEDMISKHVCIFSSNN